jgi:tRNA-specific 2-thiouridylase
MKKVIIAMSGGVDSSVAAALLKEQGYEVTGLTMRLTPHAVTDDARKAADRLDIPHYVIDFREFFERTVINDFCREYRRGRTPNPCVRCNRYLKFGALWEKAAEMGADCIATGHYARTGREDDKILLKKGADAGKDQSYFLCRLTREQLQHAMFPIGHLTKSQVRQIAREMGLPNAARPESREICFIPDNDHAGFIRDYLQEPLPPGPITDAEGNVLGEHRGLPGYTIGQRHGLGIAAAAPLYVTAIAPERNAVIVGTQAQARTVELIAADLNWIDSSPPAGPIIIKARVRYRHPEAEAVLTPLEDGNYYVKFTAPQAAIAPGQTVAFYDGDTVLGGGTILRQGR